MARIKVHSTLCDHEHEITSKAVGSDIEVNVETTCSNIEGLMELKVPINEILTYGENFVCKMAYKSRCTATCLVPTAILISCWLEAGLLSKTLCKKMGPPTIEFCDLENKK